MPPLKESHLDGMKQGELIGFARVLVEYGRIFKRRKEHVIFQRSTETSQKNLLRLEVKKFVEEKRRKSRLVKLLDVGRLEVSVTDSISVTGTPDEVWDEPTGIGQEELRTERPKTGMSVQIIAGKNRKVNSKIPATTK